MSDNTANDSDIWSDIQVAKWAGTKRSLHLYAQMLGKMRLVLSPFQPNWMFTALYLTARGLTTGIIPWSRTSVEASLDVFSSEITIASSSGVIERIALLPVRTIAEVYAAISSALAGLHVPCHITPTPQEIPDTTPLDQDRRPSEYDPDAARRWFRVVTATAAVFDQWRSHFFGRSGIQLWWGAFDFALILFNGKHVAPPADRGYLMKYDLDAQLMNVGLYFGDQANSPFFYGYIYPEPKGAGSLPIAPKTAAWSTQLHEWVLPYDAVRLSSDPEAEIRSFIDSIYEQCFAAAGWDREALTYKVPSHRPS